MKRRGIVHKLRKRRSMLIRAVRSDFTPSDGVRTIYYTECQPDVTPPRGEYSSDWHEVSCPRCLSSRPKLREVRGDV